jgi:DNA topoisomerase-1
MLAAMALGEFEKADTKARAKKNVTRAVERVASMLGNTPTICRKCYIHPSVVDAYLDGNLLLEVQKDIDKQLSEDMEALRAEEAAVLSYLRARIGGLTTPETESGETEKVASQSIDDRFPAEQPRAA